MKNRRISGAVGHLLALFPLAVLAVFAAYVVRTRLAAGHWPSYNNPESWSQGFTTHYAILRPFFYQFPIWIFPPIALIYTITLWVVRRHFPKGIFFTLALSTLIIGGMWFFDPFGFLNWFYD